jgi:ubiquinone/menaquinone biosynthesis C-methylase UbiE
MTAATTEHPALLDAPADAPGADAPGADEPGDDGAPDSGSAAATWAASAWSEAEARASALIRRSTGDGLSDHLLSRLGVRPGVQMLAIGAAAGGLATELMQHTPQAEMVCIDSRPEWLEAGRRRARELALNAQFAAVDLDTIELEPRAFDLAFCHAALHRVVALEAVADQIKRALRPGGTLLIVDVVTRNGHAMWPETREVATAIWKTLPVQFRLNHTAYTTPLIDDAIWEPEPLPSGAESARPEDILPVLEARFSTQAFVPYFSLARRFFDSMYGPNYDFAAPLDRAVFNWIWQLDIHYLAAKRLRPETFFGIYRAR